MLFKTRQNKDKPGQTMVEFALALPIVLVIVFGVIEFGFLLWSYSSVNSAAREAARYGIAIGDGTISGQRYYDCEGIRNAAMKAGAFAGMEVSDIYIHYDDGSILDTANPSYTPKYNTCEELAAHSGDDEIEFGDRIVISITHDYHPIAALLGFDIQPFNMIARSNRTIVKSAIVSTGGEGGGGTGEGTACFSLFTTHSGEGADPTVSPAKSSGCDVIGEYVGGEIVTLTAAPNPGWSVAAWTGDTYDDASTSTENYLNMPGAPHTVSVIYANVNPTCYVLTLSTSGTGTGTLAADPANSSGCDPGEYLAGTYIELIATPDAGSEIGGWTGTNNDGSTSSPNYKTMPASDDTVTVEFDLTST
ncbi:MAG: pilus assembly protein, partial [Anaerolineales bacterium]|nr:pilus assembly protein [Anaerolineales bacterium]